MILGSTPYLTKQEIAVLAATAQGLEQVEVGELLGITPQTVRNLKRLAYRRLGAHNAAHAVFLAREAGLIGGSCAVCMWRGDVPGQDRLKEIVKESVERTKTMAQNIDVAANHPGGASIESVDQCARHAHESIDKAADAAKILVREGA